MNEILYPRETYLSKIRKFYDDTQMIKVLTGIRRCGKSSIMKTIMQELDGENIIYIDLDSKKYRKVKDADSLEKIIDDASTTNGINYIFIDEIQNINGFEELINAYRGEGNFSIFITGSNSYLLSGELVTKLTGRYIEFEIFTLSFSEYLGMKKLFNKKIDSNLNNEFSKYIVEGGFPGSIFYDELFEKQQYTQNVITEIIGKDIKSKRKIRHLSVFNQVMSYIINNFGATTSIKNILDYFENRQGIKIKRETLNTYLEILENAKIIYRCSRFDNKSKKTLSGEQKYYLADLSLYYSMNTNNEINYGPVYENIVYSYLKSKGYWVSVGKIGRLECDFITRDQNQDYAYYQVAMTIMNSKETENREYRALEMIKNSYPKFIITSDTLYQKRSGIKHLNIIDFINEKSPLEN